MKILLMLIPALFTLVGAHAGASSACPRKIILLPELLTGGTPGSAALSQYLVLRELDAFQTIPVFTENVKEDLHAADFRATSGPEVPQFAAFKQIFPQGVPGNFEDLSEPQKELLAESGGDVVALMAGKIETLYAAMNGHELKSADERERKALGEINAFFEIAPGIKSVILVFAAGDDLKRHVDLFDPACIITPPDLKALSGPANLNTN